MWLLVHSSSKSSSRKSSLIFINIFIIFLTLSITPSKQDVLSEEITSTSISPTIQSPENTDLTGNGEEISNNVNNSQISRGVLENKIISISKKSPKFLRSLSNEVVEDEIEDLLTPDITSEEEEEEQLTMDRNDLIKFVSELEKKGNVNEKERILPEIQKILEKENPGLIELDIVEKEENGNKESEDDNEEEDDEEDDDLVEDSLKKDRRGTTFIKNKNYNNTFPYFEKEYEKNGNGGGSNKKNNTLLQQVNLQEPDMAEMDINLNGSDRQYSMYLLQGQYYPEPRLNRFVDGAFRNMGSSLRIGLMDPLTYNVFPGGVVESSYSYNKRARSGSSRQFNNNNPRRKKNNNNNKSKIKLKGAKVKKGAVAANKVAIAANKKKQNAGKRKPNKNNTKSTNNKQLLKQQGKVGNKKNKNNNNNIRRRVNKRRRRPVNVRIRNRRRRRKPLKPLKRRKRLGAVGNAGIRRNRRKIPARRRSGGKRKAVGNGQIEGLSSIIRDGDAEMQQFGNYTLIRSHLKHGPLSLSIKMKTLNGVKTATALIPKVLSHAVTRVNLDGSELVDFVVDKIHPENIKLSNGLIIGHKAERVAKNIFSKLFNPDSFVVAKLREKASLAMLSKPTSAQD